MILDVTAFGAIDDGITDCTASINCAIAAASGGDVLYFPIHCREGYKITDTIMLPHRTLFFKGDGAWSANIIMHAPKPLFYYARASGDQGYAIFDFYGLTFIRKDLGRETGTYAIWSKGYDDNHADNYLRVSECAFYGWEAAVKAKWTGQSRIEKCFFTSNTYSAYLERGASFWIIRDCMSFDNTFIKAYDPVADAYSNALFIDSCSNVCAHGTCLDATGWQAIWVDKCGWDLGSAGTGALNFTKCQDVSVAKSYISGDGLAVRNGVNVVDTPRVSLIHNRIVNCRRGIVAEFSVPTAGAIVIDGNEFDGNAFNDVLFRANITASKVINNHFAKQMARTGTDFEVFIYTPGSDSNLVAFNTFNGAHYGMGPMPNSIVGSNIFNAPAG